MQSKVYNLEFLLIFYLNPAFGFLLSSAAIPGQHYFRSYTSISYLLLVLILYRASQVKLSLNHYFPFFLLILLCSLDYIHYFTDGITFQGMSDIRLILYSPYTGPFLTAGLYLIYLMLVSPALREYHLEMTLRLFYWFGLMFIPYWILLYVGVLPNLNNTNFLNANGVSYLMLFLLFCSLLDRTDLIKGAKASALLFFLFTSVMFLNGTRGAILVLLVVLVLLFYDRVFPKISLGIFGILGLAVAVSGWYVSEKFELSTVLLGPNFQELTEYLLDKRELGGDLGDTHDPNVNNTLTQSEITEFENDDISSASRLLTNFLTLIAFAENPFFGVGTVRSFGINVLGNNSHSFFFLTLSSIGVVGVVLMALFYSSVGHLFGATKNVFIVVVYALGVLQFTNQFPIYFALLPLLCVNAAPQSESETQKLSYT
ncbi:O-antigen ligase family protein [Gammaproteobacteria bacterium]|nr:O-antigen ligase family protein [Gammaproteobacteria bacterium]